MDGIVEALLRLEGAKHRALINADAQAYDELVRTQLNLLDSDPAFEASARKSPETLAALSQLIRHNTTLFLNLVSTSSIFALNSGAYTSTGCAEAQVSGRVAMEA